MTRRPRPAVDGQPPSRELDEEKRGERAKAPPGLIRNPVKLPPMRPVKR